MSKKSLVKKNYTFKFITRTSARKNRCICTIYTKVFSRIQAHPFFQEFRIVYTIGSKQYKCTIQYVEYVFLPHFSCFFSRIQISSSQSTQKIFKNSDYLHWILKEKSNEMEFCLTFEKIPIMFFFYSENLPLHKSTQKFFKNSSKKRGVGFV